MLPLQTASKMGGLLGRLIGSMSNRTNIALHNIKLAMPELHEDQVKNVITGMWDNLGRTFAEFPHISDMDPDNFKKLAQINGLVHLDRIRNNGKSAIFFSGHLANWELAPKSMAMCDFPLALVYRKGNNPGLDQIIQGLRSHYQTTGVPKGKDGSRRLIKLIQQGRHIGMLIDQKMNDGIEVDFFKRGAMTAPAIAKLALKFNCPVIPVKVARTSGSAHEVTIYPPVEVTRTKNDNEDIYLLMTKLNGILENWIRENPSQWIWLHNRWPKNERAGRH